VFEQWNRGTGVTVKKNPSYWQAGKPYLDAIDFRILTDPTSRASAIESGDLDLIVTDEPSTINKFKGKPDVKVIFDASGDAQQVVLNESSPPFDNINARKAVTLATDPEALTEGFGDRLLKPIDQPFADGSPYHQADPHYPKHDDAAAKAAVAQYTAETGQPLEFSLTVFSGDTNLQIAQILQQQWAKAGITATINSQEQATAIKDILVGKFQGLLSPNFGYPDPDFNYIFWHSSYTGAPGALSINFAHVKNDEVDKQLLQGRVNLLPQQRQAAYQAAVRALNENYSYVWLYRYVVALVADRSVRGLAQVEKTGFAGLQFRPWYGDLWLDRSGT
jgi:peptide/nickel transport system substrate-binding protein